MNSTLIRTWLPLIMTRWRQGRRMFDSRLLNERRLIICAVLAGVWFVLDATLLTPSYARFADASKRNKAAIVARDALQSEINRRKQDLMVQEAAARQEIQSLTESIARGKQAIASQQSMLAPAREMRALLEGLLVQNGRLQLQSMRTLVPEEVKFNPVAGLAISQALLYRQSLDIAVSGSFMEVLTWLRSVEAMPRKLLWDGMTMKTEENGKVLLVLQVHTFSPDRNALEIVP